jgi:hypothetical protein
VSSSSLEEERAELEAVLASERFSRSPQLGRLLIYLCEKYFDGRADQIKEYNIATEVLGRPQEFDSTQDAIARVEAHRLRKKLAGFYASEGAERKLRIVLAPGKYVPVFQHARKPPVPKSYSDPDMAIASSSSAESQPASNGQLDQPAVLLSSPAVADIEISSAKRHWPVYLIGAGLLIAAVLGLWRIFSREAAAYPVPGSHLAGKSPLAVEPGESIVRLLAGCTSGYTDRAGNRWDCDRHAAGGSSASYSHRFVARTNDSLLFQNGRTGDFYYRIPLKPGTYELHLLFAEMTYGPGTPAGGGENSRTFLIKLNGQVLLDNFDVLADANGPAVADERVFRDVHPDSDGRIHLQFFHELGDPILSAVEIIPGIPGRQIPIRLVSQEKAVTDREGRRWAPDNFFNGGQLIVRKDAITGTPDPNLFAAERFGNFNYAIPVDTRGTYDVTAYFAEGYWGSPLDRTGSGPGSRIFDIACNGQRLLNNLDIYKEVGGMHALAKTFRGLRPNAQGKLILSFAPVVNYASVSALEVEDEGK